MTNNSNDIETIDRDYVDNYSVKELVVDNIMPAYFPEIDTDNIVTGETGMLAELLGTITEDSFNEKLNSGSIMLGAFYVLSNIFTIIFCKLIFSQFY